MIYFATHWTLIIWVEIKTLQVRQQAKKAPDAWSQHETTHTQTTTTRKIDKFELLFILVIMTGSLILVLNRWYQTCFVRSQQILIHSLRLFSQGTSLLLSNLASHASEATDFVIGPEYSNTPTIFDHWVDVLMNTSAPSHWLNSFAWPVSPVLKSGDIPDCFQRWLFRFFFFFLISVWN